MTLRLVWSTAEWNPVAIQAFERFAIRRQPQKTAPSGRAAVARSRTWECTMPSSRGSSTEYNLAQTAQMIESGGDQTVGMHCLVAVRSHLPLRQGKYWGAIPDGASYRRHHQRRQILRLAEDAPGSRTEFPSYFLVEAGRRPNAEPSSGSFGARVRAGE